MDYLRLPRRLIFKGDVNGCQKYIGRGHSLLSLCEQQASFRKLQQSTMTRSYEGGATITATISFGMATIEIDCRSKEEKKPKLENVSNFIIISVGDEENGYNVATFNAAGVKMQDIYIRTYENLIRYFPPIEQENCYYKIEMNALGTPPPANDCPAIVEAEVVDCFDVKTSEVNTLPEERLWISQYIRQWGENPVVNGETVYDVYQDTARVGEGCKFAPSMALASIYNEVFKKNTLRYQSKGKTLSITSYFARYYGNGSFFWDLDYEYSALGLNIEETPLGIMYPEDKYFEPDEDYAEKRKALLLKHATLIEEFSEPFEADAAVFWFGLPYRNWTGAPKGDTIQGYLPLQIPIATAITAENPNATPYKTAHAPLVFPHRFAKKTDQFMYQLYFSYYKEGYFELNKDTLVFEKLSEKDKFYIAAGTGLVSGSALGKKRSAVFEKNVVSFFQKVVERQKEKGVVPPEHIPFAGKVISYISDPSVFASGETPDEQAVFFLLNKYRKDHGLEPLVFNCVLEEAAIRHAVDMAKNNVEDHPGSDGSTPLSRTQDTLYFIRCDPTNPGMIGENIAWGQLTPEAVMAAWKASPQHNSNMLYEGWRDVAISKRIRADGKPCWVQVFGALPEAIGG